MQGTHQSGAVTPPIANDSQGAVRITKHVLASIIEMAALGVEGVARLAPVSSPWPRLWRAEPQRGIATNAHGKTLSVDLYLILQPGVHMSQVGRAVQEAVAKAIEDILGMTPGEINVFIQDVA
ncbi:MAG: Asp23/Gls24 family envelope stress response protein [Ktedonobacterales bacterium]|nr:Asp23/Gls24 family envelope stress response protein [Ktedonobacterales bacterium]